MEEKLRRPKDEVTIDRAFMIARKGMIHSINEMVGAGVVSIEVRLNVHDGTVTDAEVITTRSNPKGLRIPLQHD